MKTFNYEIEINVPVDRVYEYYTNSENVKKAWPRDIVKESQSLSGPSNEGSEMKVKGEYMGKEDEMILEITDKEQNNKLITEQKDGPFKYWKSTQKFSEIKNGTRVTHTIDYEMPMSGKILNFFSGKETNNVLEQGLHQSAETVKQNLESR